MLRAWTWRLSCAADGLRPLRRELVAQAALRAVPSVVDALELARVARPDDHVHRVAEVLMGDPADDLAPAHDAHALWRGVLAPVPSPVLAVFFRLLRAPPALLEGLLHLLLAEPWQAFERALLRPLRRAPHAPLGQRPPSFLMSRVPKVEAAYQTHRSTMPSGTCSKPPFLMSSHMAAQSLYPQCSAIRTR